MRETVASIIHYRYQDRNQHRYGGQDIPTIGTRIRTIYDKLSTGNEVSFEEYERNIIRRSLDYLRNIYGFEIETIRRGRMRAIYRLKG